MDENAQKELVVLGVVMRGAKKFDRIQRESKLSPEELNAVLERLESSGRIRVQEKKGLLGRKIEIFVTEDGMKEVDQQVRELSTAWQQMQTIYKSGDKNKMKGFMDDNRSILPMMLFFGIVDMMMFSMMFSMMGATMTDYMQPDSMPEGHEAGGDADGGMDGGDFDFDVGF